MGTGASLRSWLPSRAVLRLALGTGGLAGGAALLLSVTVAAGFPAPETLERTRGQVETLENGRRALHFTLTGRQERLHYPRWAGEVETVRALLERARTEQALFLLDPRSGAVYEVDVSAGARRHADVGHAWRDRQERSVGLGLALIFIGGRLALGRPS